MLSNPNYAFSLIVAFALGFVAVLALPVGDAGTRDTLAMRAGSSTSGSSVHHKAPLPGAAPEIVTASIAGTESARGTASAPMPEPARQVAIASPMPAVQDEDRQYSPAEPPASSKWAHPSRTKLVSLASAPFPYSGSVPRTNRPFLNVREGGRLGRKTRSGRVYWQEKTYSDPRVLLHIPRGFDTARPAVMVLFFHGHGATLARDVVARQRLPAQISDSGVNAVLVAPQFAVDARDSAAGNLWKEGGARRFLDEAAGQLARLLGDERTRQAFARMPVVVIGYSGGYVPAAWTLHNGGISERVKGVVLLDGLYGELDKFARWIGRADSAFFLSAYATSTRRGNAALKDILDERGISYGTELGPELRPGSVTFLEAVKGHRDYVTRAWAENPVSDLLHRMAGTVARTDPARSAALARTAAN